MYVCMYVCVRACVHVCVCVCVCTCVRIPYIMCIYHIMWYKKNKQTNAKWKSVFGRVKAAAPVSSRAAGGRAGGTAAHKGAHESCEKIILLG